MNKSEIESKLAKAAARKEKRKANAEFIAKIGGRPKLLSLPKLEKKRWDAFSLYIRERDKFCFSCTDGKAEQAGHVISRRKKATKYHPLNVLGQCATCNFKDKNVPGYHDHCVAAFMAKFSPDVYLSLVQLSKADHKEDRGGVATMTEIYKEAYGKLKNREWGAANDSIFLDVPPAWAGKVREEFFLFLDA